MLKNIYEIFNEVKNAASKKDAVLVLRYNQSFALKSVLKGMFDPRIKFCITTIPEYKKSDAPIGMGYTSIHQEIHRAYLFVEGEPKAANVSQKRKEEILIQILEALEQKEAEVYANMVLKKNPYKGLSYSLVKEAFPDILP
jgi:hypothetical protein